MDLPGAIGLAAEEAKEPRTLSELRASPPVKRRYGKKQLFGRRFRL
jgi:hypothetical protein